MNASAFAPRTGYQRLRLTVDDVTRMAAHGLIAPDASTELIDGELIYMPSEGEPHINVKTQLNRWFARALDDSAFVAPDVTLHLSPTDAPEPDLYVFDAGAKLKPIDPDRVRLVVEVSDSSLGRDLQTKSPLYARYGLFEYWVVDIGARLTHVHRGPVAGAYPAPALVGFSAELRADRLPDLPPLVIADLPYIG